MFNTNTLWVIFDKTKGCCHFCGDKVVFTKYGSKNIDADDGGWEADHVEQKGKGGSKSAENCMPACIRCNRLRWHRSGHEVWELLMLGILAKEQIRKKSALGTQLLELQKKRRASNLKRRRQLHQSSAKTN